MAKFTDTIRIKVKAGHGGPGSVSFRREKYIAKGGPDGGDGGKGGDVYFVADRRYYNLSHLFVDRLYAAKRGQHGMGMNRHGKDGEDLTIIVPPGTELVDEDTGEVIGDLLEEEKPLLVATGGIGGRGNVHFKSSVMQAPRFAQPGLEGDELTVRLNLKLIADVGLVGLPNAGKSTLLSTITNARPKIGDYPFTTLIPNLGVISTSKGNEYKIADIPGIIEGAHKGMGLGLSFLQHIERVKVLLYLIEIDNDDPLYTYKLLESELVSYNKVLAEKPSLIILSKSDLSDKEYSDEMVNLFKKETSKDVITISSVSGENLELFFERLESILEK